MRPMRTTAVTAALTLTMALSGCGFSAKLNPFNWFGRSREVPQEAVAEAPADPRGLVADVVSMTVEPYPGGAIVRATGLPPTQGYWSAELVAQPVTDKGVLVLEFRIAPPVVNQPAGAPRTREVVAAISLSDIRLEPVREIVVQGASNARSSRR